MDIVLKKYPELAKSLMSVAPTEKTDQDGYVVYHTMNKG
jgi:hypothetical protein